MTAASYTSRTFAPTSSAALRVQRALAALAVCLPVPICAASGLSLPLPATVERIAAALVPWADAVQMSANEALAAGATGSIVERAGEPGREVSFLPAATPGRSSVKARASVLIPRPGMFVPPSPRGTMELGDSWPALASAAVPAPHSNPSKSNAAGDRPQPTSAPEPAPASSESPAAAPAPTPAPAPPATTKSPEPAPAPTSSEPDLIAPVTNIVEPVVEPIVAPVVPIVEETTSVVKETVAPVTGLLPGLGNP
jgi:hypothetical protein